MALQLKVEKKQKHRKFFVSFPDGTNKKYVGNLIEKRGPNGEKLLVGEAVMARCQDTVLMEDVRVDITGAMLTIKG